MPKATVSETEFLELLRKHGTYKAAKLLGINGSNIRQRRQRIERRTGIQIDSPQAARNKARGFQRIRYFGFLANRFRKEKLALCRQLLRGTRSDLLPSAEACRELRKELAEPFVPRCPKCGIGHMLRIAVLRAYRWPAIPPPDSS